MRIFPLASAVVLSFVACQPGQAAAEVPRAVSPTVDVEIDDRGGASNARVARFSLSLVDGRAEIAARDAEAKTVIIVKPGPDARLAIEVRRIGHDDLEIAGAIPDKPSGRVLVGRVERPSGAATSVVAQLR